MGKWGRKTNAKKIFTFLFWDTWGPYDQNMQRCNFKKSTTINKNFSVAHRIIFYVKHRYQKIGKFFGRCQLTSLNFWKR